MDAKATKQFNCLKLKNDSIAQSIAQIHSYVDKVQSDKSVVPIFKAMLPTVENLFEEFSQNYSKIVDCCAGFELGVPEEPKNLQESVNIMYYTVKGLGETLFAPENKPQISSDLPNPHIYGNPLPTISLPVFYGESLKFKSFKDLFLSIVHRNDRLTPSMKFNYLKTCLKDKALSLISHLDITDANYPIAWQTLLDQYDSNRTVASELLNQMLNFPSLVSDAPGNLDKFLSVFSELGLALNQMCIKNLSEFVLFHIAFRALDSHIRKQFLLEHPNVEFPSLRELVDFVKKCRKAMCEPVKPLTTSKSVSAIKNPSNYRGTNKVSLVSTQSDSCLFCDGQHRIFVCAKFKSLSVFKRNAFVKGHNYCFNCLSPSHKLSLCTSTVCCKYCKGKHNSLLCFKEKNFQINPTADSSGESVHPSSRELSQPSLNNVDQINSCSSEISSPSSPFVVLLGTAVICVRGKNNSTHRVRALIDSGSQASYITANCVQMLGLKKQSASVLCTGIGAVPSQTPSGVVSLQVYSEGSPSSWCTQALVIPKIVNPQPSVKIPSVVYDKYKHLKLADPMFHISSDIHVLIGADLFSSIVTGEKITFPPGLPTAWNSIFGYILLGHCDVQSQNISSLTTCTSTVSVELNSDVNKILQQFWKLEEVPCTSKPLSPDEIRAEEMFTTLHYREPCGRYVVPLLVKSEEVSSLGPSFNTASVQLKSLQRKLGKIPELKLSYTAFMQDYQNMCHMSVAPMHSGAYYIPHHPVLRTDTRGLKLRVVFNASSPSGSGHSLNSLLLTGPKLQKPIDQVITRFRLFPIAIVCDIQHNFRMINIRPCDKKFLHILWSPDDSSPVQEFELDTVTYGTASAPYLALRTTEQVCRDEGHRFPLAASIIQEQIFVDDILGGASTLEEAQLLISQLIELMGSCGFKLHKWASNVQSGLFNMCRSRVSLDIENSATFKVLGLQWCPLRDEFCYTVNLSCSANTKRSVLSNIARVFDPLGWISPITVRAKQFLQTLWRLGLEWDDPLPDNELKEWQEFVSSLTLISQFSVPRVVLPPNTSKWSLIGFCDASEKSYAAVVYLRSHSLNVQGVSHLIMSKTKVTPVKPLTIPRLELLGAVLLMRLMNHVHDALTSSLNFSQVFAFTDSSVVLSWLRTEPYKLKTFVCHRVVTILNSPVPMTWKHVRSSDNPSDLASRGCLPAQLLQAPLWLSGPQWLSLPMVEWPCCDVTENCEIPELKISALVSDLKIPEFDVEVYISQCSSFSKLQRSVAYWLRYFQNLVQPTKILGPLSIGELRHALLILVKLVQNKYFCEDMRSLSDGKDCSTRLKSLSPFLSSQGLLLVGGRLQNSELSFYAQHPMILPKSSALTKLLIEHYHVQFLHVGANTLNYLLRSKFWIISSRTAIRKVLSTCLVCRKLHKKPSAPLMGNLPAPRVKYSRPFLHTGVDMAGPFLVKESLRRNAKLSKSYLCIFVCLSIKAVHLELVSALTTEAFLAAFDRFTSRRGLCSDVYSDEGRNFVGADRLLRQAYKSLFSSNVLASSMTQRSVVWHFNPPFAPNFGGIWEANIRSAKTHLKKVIGNRALTFEELTTVFCRVEAVMNCRPLISVPGTPVDAPAISPSHFLVGSLLLTPPEPSLLEENPDILKRWSLVSHIRQHFAQRWTRDYLNTLQQRSKFQKDPENLKVDDLVWVLKGDTPVGDWPLGRVLKVFPGDDGRVRVAKVLTAHGEYVRPVSKLVKLGV